MITVTPAAGGCSRPPRPPARDPDVRRAPVCGRRTFTCTVVGIAPERGPRFPPRPNNTPTWIQSTDEYKTKQAGSRKRRGRHLFLDDDPVKRIGEHSCRRRRMVRPRDHQQRCGKRQHDRRRLGPLLRDVRGDGILPGGNIDAWRSVRDPRVGQGTRSSLMTHGRSGCRAQFHVRRGRGLLRTPPDDLCCHPQTVSGFGQNIPTCAAVCASTALPGVLERTATGETVCCNSVGGRCKCEPFRSRTTAPTSRPCVRISLTSPTCSQSRPSTRTSRHSTKHHSPWVGFLDPNTGISREYRAARRRGAPHHRYPRYPRLPRGQRERDPAWRARIIDRPVRSPAAAGDAWLQPRRPTRRAG